MTFTAESTDHEAFDQWVQSVKNSGANFGQPEYNRLVEPSEYNPAAFYVLGDEGLFDRIVMKYMVPAK